MSPFLATTLMGKGGLGDDGLKPKPIKKLLLGSESYVTIELGRAFSKSPKSFFLHCLKLI